MLQISLVFFALVIHFTVASQLRLGLEPEEGLVKFVVVDVKFAHLWLNPLSLLLLQAGLVLFLQHRIAHLCNTGFLDELRQREGRLLYTTFGR